MWTDHRDVVVTLMIDALIHILKVCQIAGKEPLDNLGIDIVQITQAGDYARQEDDHQVTCVALHAAIFQRRDLVIRGSHAHDAIAMKVALAIHKAVGKSKGKLGL